MLRLPESNWTNINVLANWVELIALEDDDAAAFRGNVLEALSDSQLFPDSEANCARAADQAFGESPSSTVVEVWKVLKRRSEMLDGAWPFLLTESSLTRAPERTRLSQVAAYASLLLIEAASAKWYESLQIKKGDRIRTWFEEIVVASLGTMLGGRVCRFGAPFPGDWPTTFVDRVGRLASHFSISARIGDIEILSNPKAQDDSLDVVARWRIADEDGGSPYLLIQCATGANWKTDKCGEPMMSLWRNYVQWDGPQFKALAIPFTLRDKGDLQKASGRHSDAIVFDRLRIAKGNPDLGIEQDLRDNLTTWCQGMISSIPRD